MTVGQLIDELIKLDPDLPVGIDDHVGPDEEEIKVEIKHWIFFPFSPDDSFDYINLTRSMI